MELEVLWQVLSRPKTKMNEIFLQQKNNGANYQSSTFITMDPTRKVTSTRL